jgi:antitoxin MazE
LRRNYNVITENDVILELTRIGNSRGVRIPKPLIEQCGLGEVVEARVTSEGLVLAPRRAARQGWKQAFARVEADKDKMLLDRSPANKFDAEDWKW